jgi:hypothetical protein
MSQGIPCWRSAAATRAAAGLSVRYRETIGLVAGMESAGSRSEASIDAGHETVPTACFEAPILPSERSRETDGTRDDADIHLHLASHHGSPSFPYEGDRLAGKSLQRSMMTVGLSKVKTCFLEEGSSRRMLTSPASEVLLPETFEFSGLIRCIG